MEIISLETHETAPADLAVSESLAHYLSFIAHLDMPLSSKIEMVSAMRKIMASFVDSAFGDDSVQHVHEMHARDEVRRSVMLGSDTSQPETDQSDLSSAFATPAAGGEKGGVDE
ncbi:hypothetical protein [Devosia sp. MC1541]|uniref:hypothetical protein n=1 Tax=Devosia sp. MC1541 TaxID=2725264 RepID=UPI00145D5B08|nr:hypothetical protein [Devosia sp. MC1541]